MHTILLFAVLALGYASYVPDIPLFVWSGENYITSRNEQIRGYYTTETVGDLLKGFWKSDEHHGLQSLVNLKQNTEHDLELVVLFIDSALSSEELTKYHSLLPTVAQKMQESHSFYVPFVAASEPHTLRSISKAVRHAHKAGGSAYFLGSESFLDQLKEHSESSVTKISSFSEIAPSFTNGKTDVLIVYVDAESPKERLSFIDQKVKKLDQLFAAAHFSNYIVALTGVESSLESLLPSTTEMGVPEHVKRAVFVETPRAGPNNGSDYPPVPIATNGFNVYLNGVFWELLSVLLVLFGLVFFGIKQLLLLQAPDRIPTLANQQKKKKQ